MGFEGKGGALGSTRAIASGINSLLVLSTWLAESGLYNIRSAPTLSHNTWWLVRMRSRYRN